jgi:hypothetical protein
MTTLTEAKKAINDRFIADWTGTTPFTIDNEDFTETEGISWARLTVRNTAGGQVSLGKTGNRRYDRLGRIKVSIFVPVETGTSEADTLALQALNLFEGTRFNGVTVNDAVIKEIGANDTWYQITMTARFEYYEIK